MDLTKQRGRQRPHNRKENTIAKTDIAVKLVGEDGNAFAILGRCYQALVRARRRDLWEEFRKEATSSDYNHLLATVCDYFVVDADEDDDDNRWLEDSINGLCDADEED